MRLLYFSRDYTTHDRRFLLKLVESRHQVWFLRLEDDGLQYEKRPVPPGVHAVDWVGGTQPAPTPEDWLTMVLSLETVLEQIQPHVVHAGPIQSCALMAALAGCRPLVAVSWGSDILVDADRDDMWRWMTLYALRHSDMLVCDSDAVSSKIQQLLPYPKERIVQFPWGIDLEHFSPSSKELSLRRELGWLDKFVVLSTRSWNPIYGIDIVLESFRVAYAENHSLRLMLLGDGSLAATIEQYVAFNDLDSVVCCPGRVPQEVLPMYYRMADLYLNCAHSDGSSISLLEALASGLPVVVTDLPGNREWVRQGEGGWLVPSNDVQGFAEAVLDAAQIQPHERQRILLVNREIAETRANWDRNFACLLEAYHQLETEYVS